MSHEAGQESLEVERKYEVAADLPLPTAEAFAAVGLTASAPVTYELAAIYFDTPERDLARGGMAMRVRHGGKDAGWHIKQRGAEGVRELFWPPSDEMPAGVREELAARIGEEASSVAPVAELDTERTVVVLFDESGAEIVELADDRVEAFDRVAGVARVWREWEAEVLPGADTAVLDRVEPVLLAAGARVSLSLAKIARATGALIPMARAQGAEASQIAALEALDNADRAAARAAGLVTSSSDLEEGASL